MSVPPPIAKVVPHTREVHGDRVIDPYHWMSDKQDPDLLRYLEEENAFTTDATAHLEGLREEIFNDISARTKQTDMSVPIWVTHTNGDSWWYFTRTTAGLEYPRFCRIPGADRDDIPDVEQPHPDEEVLLDLNLEAEGHEFLSLGWAEVSPTGNRLAYSLDTSGDERYDLWIRDLTTRSTLDGPITGVGAGGSWLGEEWIFYNRVDAAWRPFQAWRHRVGVSGDVLVLEEADESFWLGLSGSRDRNWVVIDLSSKTSSEAHLVHVETPEAAPRCVAPRRPDVEYSIEVARDCLYILHNDGAPQFELARAPLDSSGPEQWVTVLPERPRTRLLEVDAYNRWLVVQHRTEGMTGVTVFPVGPDGGLGREQPILFPEPLYELSAGADADPDADRIRLSYESLNTPSEVIEYRMDTAQRKLLRQLPVLDHPVRARSDPPTT